MTNPPRVAKRDEIPILDLSLRNSPEGRTELAGQLRSAALGLGFFYISHHDISADQRVAAFAAAERYFALPLEERMRYPMNVRSRRGYMPLFSTTVRQYGPDRKESFDMGHDLPADDPDVIAGRFLHGPNVWPENLPWLREVMEPYLDSVTATSRTLLELLALSLEVPSDYFLDHFKKPMMHTRLFHYPAPPADAHEKEFGVAPHVDHGFLTILDQDEVGGLEVMTRSGEWVGAPYIEGALTVNFGNLLKRWTNNLYVSNTHQVVNRAGRSRYSIPTFINLDYDTMVECIPSCLSADGKALYPAASSGAILEAGLRGDEKKLEMTAPPETLPEKLN